jgi:hypothetical protein
MARNAAHTPSDDDDSRLPSTALVPVTPRQDGWTPVKQREFIEKLADTGCVTEAACAVGMSPASAYRLRRRTDARAFDAAWEAALGRAMEQLIPSAMDRALNGTIREKWYKGEVVGAERIFHEKLLIWMLEKSEAMLRHHEARWAMRQDWDGALDAIEAGQTAPPKPAKEHKVWGEGGGDRKEYWYTDSPPPPDYHGVALGKPGDKDYMRLLSAEELHAWRWSQEHHHPATPLQEAQRRRFFNLDAYATAQARAVARKSARHRAAAQAAATSAAAAQSDPTPLAGTPANSRAGAPDTRARTP